MTPSPTPRVFVVDDDEAVRDALKTLIEAYGMHGEAYGSPGDFLGHYRAGPRQCLILDQHLGIMTGLDFLASHEGKGIDLPVILLTGHGDSSIRDRAYVLGAVDYLEKPVPSDRLLKAITDAVG